MSFGGIGTAASSSNNASPQPNDDTHLIYDDCPGGRALAAAAVGQQHPAFSFHSLPHYHQSAFLQQQQQQQQIAQQQARQQQNTYHQSANSTPRRIGQSASPMGNRVISFSQRNIRTSPPSQQHVYATPPPIQSDDSDFPFRQNEVFNMSLDGQVGGSGTLTGGGGSLSSKTESNTVVENVENPSRSRSGSWKGLSKDNNGRSLTSLGSKSGGSYILANHKDSDDEDDENGANMSSEDNLSHESYELIEKEDDHKVDPEEITNLTKCPPPTDEIDSPQIISKQRKGSNHFEQEFYRQVATTKSSQPDQTRSPKNQADSKHDQATNSSSSRISSRCSMNSSSILSPIMSENQPKQPVTTQPNNSMKNAQQVTPVIIEQEPRSASGLDGIPVKVMARVNSQDSFSQASNHNVTILTPPSSTPIQPSTIQSGESDSIQNLNEGEVPYDDFHGHEINLHCLPQTPEERLMIDIVRKRGGMLMKPQIRNPQPHLYHRQHVHHTPPQFPHYHQHHVLQQQYQQYQPQHHSLPRQMHQMQRYGSHEAYYQQQDKLRYQQQVGYHQDSRQQAAHLNPYSSKTLPNHRRGGATGIGFDKQTSFYPGRRQAGECSSGSSSSHASPRIVRPSSLEFNMAAEGGPGTRPKPPSYQGLDAGYLQHDYDDSSSAISGVMTSEPPYYATSSSDVPQTPENPNTTLLDPVQKKYYMKEERIYDVPEGIEGVTDKQHQMAPVALTSPSLKLTGKRTTSSGIIEITDVTSPSSSSGITDPFPRPSGLHGNQGLPPPTTAPPPVPGQVHESMATSSHLLPKVDIDSNKFHTLLSNLEQRNSTESCENTSIPKPVHGILRPKFVIPPPQSRVLLPQMSSTEDESALSARSAPTPVGDGSDLIDKDESEKDDYYEHKSGTIKEGRKRHVQPKLSVNLISPPAESESSTAVLDSEGVPAPPEFSGAASDNDEPDEDTDVEEEYEVTPEAPAEAVEHAKVEKTSSTNTLPEEEVTEEIHEETTTVSQESKLTVIIASKFSSTDIRFDEEPLKSPNILTKTESSDSPLHTEIHESDDDQAQIVVEPVPEEVVKISEMYVKRVDGNNSGASTISDDGTEDVSCNGTRFPYIDQEKSEREAELIEHLDGLSCGGSSNRPEVVVEEIREKQHLTCMPVATTASQGSSSSSDPPPPPPEIEQVKSSNLTKLQCRPKDSFESDIPPPPPPPQVSAAFLEAAKRKAAAKAEGINDDPGGLSRLSESGSSVDGSHVTHSSGSNTKESSTKDLTVKDASPLRSRSGSEGSNERPEDTMSEQNYTTSEDNENNPPSLCSDLPENATMIQKPPIAAKPSLAKAEEFSGSFPSPPSSMLEATSTTATQEGKTEVTQVEPDSLFLEITPPDFEDDKVEDEDDKIDDIAKDIPEKHSKLVEKIPYDISISSENDVTNEQETQEGHNSEGSLHDSMEILEEVATEDHFERDLESDCDERDIFEMPPISTVVLTPPGVPPAAAGMDIELEPDLVDPQQAIHKLREHTHSPNCRPPAPGSTTGDEFIL